MAVESEKIRSLVEKHNSEKKALISILQDIQSEYRYLPRESLELVAEMLGVPLSISWASPLSIAHSASSPGENTRPPSAWERPATCAGGPKILEEFERRLDIKSGDTTADGKWSLETVACLGCCAIGPVVVVDGDYHAQTSIRNVNAIIKKYQKKEGQ